MKNYVATSLLPAAVLVLAGCAVLIGFSTTAYGITVEELRCEYRVNPLGIDVVQPRLNWILQSSQRGEVFAFNMMHSRKRLIRYWWPAARGSSSWTLAIFGTAVGFPPTKAIRWCMGANP